MKKRNDQIDIKRAHASKSLLCNLSGLISEDRYKITFPSSEFSTKV